MANVPRCASTEKLGSCAPMLYSVTILDVIIGTRYTGFRNNITNVIL